MQPRRQGLQYRQEFKGSQGSSQSSKGGEGSPDGALSPPERNEQPRIGGQREGGRVVVVATPGGSSLEGVGAILGQCIVL